MLGPRRLAPLAHPGWWAALGVLVLNDHVLKHAAPGVLTGKLSDFAGLLVAPVLVAALFGARTDRARWLAFAVCAIPFSAINLSPALAGLWDAAVGWRTTPDRTDLVALAVAPLAVRMAAADPPRILALERAAVALGALACIATSGPGDPWLSTRGGPLFTNQVGTEVTVRVRWIDAALDCDTVLSWMDGGREDLQRALDPSLFDLARTYRLAPGEAADLTRPEAPPSASTCDALILDTDDLGRRLVVYQIGTANAELTLEERRVGHQLSGSGLFIGEPLTSAEPAACDRIEAEVAPFAWSGRAPARSQLVRAEPVSEECMELGLAALSVDGPDPDPDVDPDVLAPPELRDARVETHRLTLCAPRDLLDFTVGSALEVSVATGWIQIADTHRTLALRELATTGVAGDRPLCAGSRLPCGGYTEPVAWRFGGESIRPGERRVDVLGDGTVRTTMLDGAERVVVAHASCGLAPGLRGTLLTYTETRR